jgi:hypothetical protein
MFDNESFEHMLKNMNHNKHPMPEKDDTKTSVDETEAFEILEEMINIMRNHNLSYGCAYQIALSFAYDMTTGAIELYNQDVIENLE